MAQVISHASAFNPGHDLWVVPEAENSNWTLRLDWYLNFQGLRAQQHSPKELLPPLLDLLQRTEISPVEITLNPQDPLLIGASGRLPARWVLVLNDSQDAKTWTKRLAAVWSKMGRPSLKVFLPTGQRAADFAAEWKRHEDSEDFGLVLDHDPQSQ